MSAAIESVAVMRDVSGRVCVLLFSGGKATTLAPLSDQLATDLRDGLASILTVPAVTPALRDAQDAQP